MDLGTIILIASFAIPILIVIIIIKWVFGSNSSLKKFADELKIKQAKARTMNAKILEANPGTQGGEVRRIVNFKLQILDPIKPYEAKTTWFVETFHFNKAQAGEVIAVKVDVDDPYKIYPNVSWGIYTEGYS